MALEKRIKQIKQVVGGKVVNGEQSIYKVVSDKVVTDKVSTKHK